MNKKWMITIITAVLIFSFGGVVSAQASGSGWESQNYWGTDSYYTGWNSWDNNYGYGQYNYCQQPSYSYSYCYPNQWYSYNRAEFVQDVTFSDGAYVSPGTYFTKTWRIRNTGVNAWNSGYKLVFVSGDRLSGPSSVSIPGFVAPGQTVDISVSLIAPQTAGTYRGNWMLQSPEGTTFGVGFNGQVPVWVNISTWVNNCYYPGSSSCSWGGNTTVYPPGTVQRPGRNPYCNNKARSINDVTIKDGEIIPAGTYFTKTWRIKNGGTCVSDQNYTLIFSGGDSMGGAHYVHLPKKVYPGETVDVSIDLVAPDKPGTYRAYYKLQDNLGYTFGYGSYADTAFWTEIQVQGPATGAAAEESGSVTKSIEGSDVGTVEIESIEENDTLNENGKSEESSSFPT